MKPIEKRNTFHQVGLQLGLHDLRIQRDICIILLIFPGGHDHGYSGIIEPLATSAAKHLNDVSAGSALIAATATTPAAGA